ncbi:MAG: hypothetical protein QOH63_3245 [Acidobacteriota bacterium]|jgi:transcription initiation factor IIF auxiliary subunit|nr:hypothetical protein [Acidobacteriota bacterium]
MAFHIKSERIREIKPMRFREGGKLHYRVKIYIDADNPDDLLKVDSVVYELHPTFRERIRVSYERTRNFEIALWTYGFFDIKAKILKADKTVDEITGYVRWT